MLARNGRDFKMFMVNFNNFEMLFTNFFKHSSVFFLHAFHHLGQHFMYNRRAMFSGNKICDRSAKFLAEVRANNFYRLFQINKIDIMEIHLKKIHCRGIGV